MMVATAARRLAIDPSLVPTPEPVPPPAARAVDRSGRVWAHHDPLKLYRWLAGRNALLETVEAALNSGSPRAGIGRGPVGPVARGCEASGS